MTSSRPISTGMTLPNRANGVAVGAAASVPVGGALRQFLVTGDTHGSIVLAAVSAVLCAVTLLAAYAMWRAAPPGARSSRAQDAPQRNPLELTSAALFAVLQQLSTKAPA